VLHITSMRTAILNNHRHVTVHSSKLVWSLNMYKKRFFFKTFLWNFFNFFLLKKCEKSFIDNEKFAIMFTFKMFLRSCVHVTNLSCSLKEATNHGYTCHHLKTLKPKQKYLPSYLRSITNFTIFSQKINNSEWNKNKNRI